MGIFTNASNLQRYFALNKRKAALQAIIAEIDSELQDLSIDQRTVHVDQNAERAHVEVYADHCVDMVYGSSLTATALYEDYCRWCDEVEMDPLALPTFGREFKDLGFRTAKIAGRVRYVGVALRTKPSSSSDQRPPDPRTKPH